MNFSRLFCLHLTLANLVCRSVDYDKSMSRTNKRNELIRVASDIMSRQGYKAASLNDILTTAGIPKGSFYYYFSSKEELGLAIIDNFASQYEDKLKDILQGDRGSPLLKLRNYFHREIAKMEASGCAEGCLIGNLAQELSAQNELFRDRLNRVFAEWERYFVRCLRAAYKAGEISSDRHEELARFILASWEGAILKAKVTRSVVPMQTFVSVLFERVLSKSPSG